MPLYEYLCQQCGHEFEHLVRNDERPACPACGKRRLTKKLSVPAAHRAGSSELPCSAGQGGMCDPQSCTAQGCGLQGWG